MMTLFGYSISALVPLATLGIPIASAFLVYVYRSLGSSQRKTVSSLFLLKDLPRGVPGRQKFVPPLQFWIELMIFLALALAAAGIIAQREGEHIAIVIDSSLSMSGLSAEGATRLSLAKSQALSHISQAPSFNRFTVLSAGASTKRVSTNEVSPSVASDAVKSIESVVEQDRLATTLESLMASGEFDGIWVYTDHLIVKPENLPVRPNLRITSLPAPSERPRESNVWISDLAERSADGSSFLELSLHGSLSAPTDVSITGNCYEGSLTKVSGPALTSRAIIPTEGFVSTRLTPLPSSWDFCQVSITPNSPDIRDAIAGDNIGWISKAVSQQEVRLVSSLSTSQLGLTKLSAPKIVQREEKPLESQKSSPTIYHRMPLPTKIDSVTLAILPPSGPLPWGGGISTHESESSEIVRWNSAHPILQYLNIPTLVLPYARSLICPDTASALLFSRDGPIACAGEAPSGRYVVLGFEIFPFDGSKSPTTSVLTLNILKWLLQDLALDNRPRPPGFVLAPSQASAAVVTSERGRMLSLDGEHRAFLPGTNLATFTNEKGEPLGFVASLFSSMYESNVRAQDSLVIAAPPGRERLKGTATIDLWRYLALLALALLVFDLYRKFRGKSRWEGV